MQARTPSEALRVVAPLTVLRWTLRSTPLAAALGFFCEGLTAASTDRRRWISAGGCQAYFYTLARFGQVDGINKPIATAGRGPRVQLRAKLHAPKPPPQKRKKQKAYKGEITRI